MDFSTIMYYDGYSRVGLSFGILEDFVVLEVEIFSRLTDTEPRLNFDKADWGGFQ